MKKIAFLTVLMIFFLSLICHCEESEGRRGNLLDCFAIARNDNFEALGQIEPNKEKIIALTFDDGPRPKILLGEDGLIVVLDKYSVKGTFFLIGVEILNPQNKKAAQELFLKGHELENHTFSHSPLVGLYKKYGEQKVKKDIGRASDLIFQITGSKPKFFRPPCWIINAEVKRIIEGEGLIVCTIPMPGVKIPPKYEDVNSEDYCFAGSKIASYCSVEMKEYYPSNIAGYAKKLIKDREKKGIYQHILVFHELPKSKQALKTLIPELQKEGYKFVRLDEYFQKIESSK